jgi:DNA polymerase-3 subunit alpha
MLLSHKGKRKLTMATLPDDYDFKVRSLFVKSAEMMYQSYLRWNPELPRDVVDSAFANVMQIDSMIDAYAPDTSPRLPTLPYENPMREMANRALHAMKARGLASDERYTQRFLYEVGVIKEKGIAPYFLVVQQIVDRVKKNMLIGPGRGSAAGSLLCYLLGITNIDPIEHKLMFERFINVDRMELPDIDLDFEDVSKVKDVLREMFGEHNVACISTYNTNQIKGLLKDVCRIHDIDHVEVNKVNVNIDRDLRALYLEGETRSTVTIKLDDVYRLSPSFRDFIAKYPQIEKSVQRLYGRPRSVGRHASGVVIGDNLPAETAVFYSGAADEKVLQTSFTDGIVNKDLSNMGLVKFDILSLATLSVIRKAAELVSKRSGRTVDDVMGEIDPKRLNFNDSRVMEEVFWKGNLTGIFQSSQKGMRNLLQQVKPETFEDVAATCALYRPGPLGSGMDQMYARRKNGLEDVSYDHPILESILKDTYGCLIYQEQMLEIGRQLGNMSWKDVNRLRKLFLKKDKSKQDEFVRKEEDELKQKLVAGVVSHGMTEKQGDDLWDMCGKFGGYGFNVAHAKSYGMVTMQTAYLRTYYPVEFLAAVLAVGQTTDIQQDVDDIRRQGFKILPVDINESMDDYRLEEDSIRLSLSVVKGVGASAMQKIMESRPYVSFLDFLYRSGATKTAIIPLIKVGAFNSLEPNSGLVMKQYDLFEKLKGRTKKHRATFEEAALAAVGVTDDHDVNEKSSWERELLKFNVLHSPFTMNGRDEKVQKFVDAGVVMSFDEFVESDEIEGRIAVVVKDWKERPQKNGQMFAFVKFGTKDGREFEAPAFSAIWGSIKNILVKGDLYIATFNHKEEDPQRLIIGRPGWGHTRTQCLNYFIRIDDLE